MKSVMSLEPSGLTAHPGGLDGLARLHALEVEGPRLKGARLAKERADRAYETAQASHRQNVISQIVAVVKEHDVPVEELMQALGGVKRKSVGQPVPIKYRHPDGIKKWSGRGKTPTWLRDMPKDEWEQFAVTH